MVVTKVLCALVVLLALFDFGNAVIITPRPPVSASAKAWVPGASASANAAVDPRGKPVASSSADASVFHRRRRG
jgi:hypothetical protein